MLLIDEEEDTVERELVDGLCWSGVGGDRAEMDAADVDATGPSAGFKKIMSPCFRPASARCWDRLEVSWKGKRVREIRRWSFCAESVTSSLLFRSLNSENSKFSKSNSECTDSNRSLMQAFSAISRRLVPVGDWIRRICQEDMNMAITQSAKPKNVSNLPQSFPWSATHLSSEYYCRNSCSASPSC